MQTNDFRGKRRNRGKVPAVIEPLIHAASKHNDVQLDTEIGDCCKLKQ